MKDYGLKYMKNKNKVKIIRRQLITSSFLIPLQPAYLFDEIPDQIRERAPGVLLDIIQFLQPRNSKPLVHGHSVLNEQFDEIHAVVHQGVHHGLL